MNRLPGPLLLLLPSILLVSVLAGAALAQEDEALAVSVSQTSFEPDGASQVVLNVDGIGDEVLGGDAFTVAENGEQVDDLEAGLALDADLVDVTAALVLDVSSSMDGEPLENIKQASSDLAVTLTDQDVSVGLLTFSEVVDVVAAPTTDTDLLLEQIDGIEVDVGTALYDGVIAGVEELEPMEGITNLIVLADGEDNRSDITLGETIDTAEAAGVPVTVIALDTPFFEPDVLRPLAEETGGRFVMVEDVEQFAAVFDEVATDVASQYVVTYTSTDSDSAELAVEIAVDHDGQSVDTSFVVSNPRTDAAIGASPPPASLHDPGVFGTANALYAALGAAFIALLLLLYLLFVPRGDRKAVRTLRRGLSMTQRRARGAEVEPSSGLSASEIGQRALEVISATPKPEGYEDRIQRELDRAGWQIRTSEYIALRILGLIGGLALLWALSGAIIGAVVGAVVGFYVPTVLLLSAKQRRFNRFMEQLPQTLQLLSGTLRAGYGVQQALDTIVKETTPPISEEFQRVLTESRLGLPLEDSLNEMAERVDSDDFRWIVVAIVIQRQVGGNLAELLETVSETLRSREQTRRQIQTLSAEGRLSAIVLVALPALLLVYMLVVNPAYITPLVTNPIGLIMSGGALLLMLVGVLWMRRMIKIEV